MYENYITDCLKLITENTGKFVAGGYMKQRFYDISNPPKEPEKEETAEEVISRISNKLDDISKGR